MTLPGETFNSGLVPEPGDIVSDLMILRSGAGFYLGTQCYDPEVEAWVPYTRESIEYWKYESDARRALTEGAWTPRV